MYATVLAAATQQGYSASDARIVARMSAYKVSEADIAIDAFKPYGTAGQVKKIPMV